MHKNLTIACGVIIPLLAGCGIREPATAPLARIVVRDPIRLGYAGGPEQGTFTPWGFNYDRTALDGRDVLLEDVLSQRPEKLDEDFAAMRRLGGNVARVFIATHLILRDAEHVDEDGLARLTLLLKAAERQQIRLILVGLANLRPASAPAWFQQADDDTMAAAERRFWQAVARTGRASPAIFAYDLQNEPALYWNNGSSWTDGCFDMSGGQRFCYVHRHERQIEQCWTRHVHTLYATPEALRQHWADYPCGETWEHIAVPAFDGKDLRFAEYAAWHTSRMGDWAMGLREAIRSEDTGHLITIGALDPLPMARAVDFYCLHLYPQTANSAENFRTRNRAEWARQIDRVPRDKPLIIEEMYPIALAPGITADAYLTLFLECTRPRAAGWVSFYWGEPQSLPTRNPIASAMYAEWLGIWLRSSPLAPIDH